MGKIHVLRNILQIKIALAGAKPAIYRTILIEDDRTFYDFHNIIQIVMGWENYHLFQFLAGKYVISDPTLLEEDGILNSKEIRLKQLFHEVGDKMKYEYDFGDGWIHNIRLEKILPFKLTESYPTCIKGKRRCPPEDCGGIWGYENLIEVMADKKHPEYKETKSWLGGVFDPEEFDIQYINEELKGLNDYIKNSMYEEEDVDDE
ncbi:MAG: hypothetical protein COW71_06050 [Ignavibacteriales bacterium CG18_big_fil_WC_8_21_14_2_50_31_20]|nr:MAG: hypothetical protein COW71_06050 [Ignavibacteriales bacterium CG18_big_fil_WC_8_21_14_2_50_31_20]